MVQQFELRPPTFHAIQYNENSGNPTSEHLLELKKFCPVIKIGKDHVLMDNSILKDGQWIIRDEYTSLITRFSILSDEDFKKLYRQTLPLANDKTIQECSQIKYSLDKLLYSAINVGLAEAGAFNTWEDFLKTNLPYIERTSEYQTILNGLYQVQL